MISSYSIGERYRKSTGGELGSAAHLAAIQVTSHHKSASNLTIDKSIKHHRNASQSKVINLVTTLEEERVLHEEEDQNMVEPLDESVDVPSRESSHRSWGNHIYMCVCGWGCFLFCTP